MKQNNIKNVRRKVQGNKILWPLWWKFTYHWFIVFQLMNIKKAPEGQMDQGSGGI